MDFVKGERKKQNRSQMPQSELYQHALQMYRVPPIDDITLNEFNNLAIERLKVLRIVEQTILKHGSKQLQSRDHFVTELRKNKLLLYTKRTSGEEVTPEEYEERRRDHISHFILRLAYCKTEKLRGEFLKLECELFKLRFLGQADMIASFLEVNRLNYTQITQEEKSKLLQKLVNSGFRLTEDHVSRNAYFKIPFTEVLDLVHFRKVYVEKGYAYVPRDDIVSVVLNVFRSNLSHALVITARRLPQLEDDTRLLEMTKGLNHVYLGNNYNTVTNSGEIGKDAIDELSKNSFPLCMRILHESLRQNHHLRHVGRLQYGLFLKGIGISLEDAMTFFREEFTRIMDIDKFEKQYVYNIRYNYGKEGKRTNFTPYSCMKIIVDNSPGPGESHGCPFKHADSDSLKQKLRSLRLSTFDINEVTDLASKGHYQLACTRYFEAMHRGATVDQSINHPNQYFTESRKILGGNEPTFPQAKSAPSTTRAQVYSSQVKNDTDMDDADELMSSMSEY